MALPILTYSPLQSSYSFRDSESDVVATQMDGGAPFFRQNVEGNTFFASVGWVLSGADISAFFTFFQTTLSNGSLPFQLELLVDGFDFENGGMVLTNHKCYFSPNSLKVSWLSENTLGVSAELEVQPNEYDIEQGLDIVGAYNEFGRAWRTLFPPLEDELDQIVNEDWPGVWE